MMCMLQYDSARQRGDTLLFPCALLLLGLCVCV